MRGGRLECLVDRPHAGGYASVSWLPQDKACGDTSGNSESGVHFLWLPCATVYSPWGGGTDTCCRELEPSVSRLQVGEGGWGKAQLDEPEKESCAFSGHYLNSFIFQWIRVVGTIPNRLWPSRCFQEQEGYPWVKMKRQHTGYGDTHDKVDHSAALEPQAKN